MDDSEKVKPQPHYLSVAQLLAAYEAAGQGGSTRALLLKRQLAEAVGITGATLTHHLNAMHAQGLVARARDDANRRVQVVTLTEAGEAAFVRLREAAIAFDAASLSVSRRITS